MENVISNVWLGKFIVRLPYFTFSTKIFLTRSLLEEEYYKYSEGHLAILVLCTNTSTIGPNEELR